MPHNKNKADVKDCHDIYYITNMKISNKTYRWELGATTYTEVNFNKMYAVNKTIATDEEIEKFKINYWDGNKKSYIVGYLTAFGNRREKLAKNQYKEIKE